MTDEKTPGGPSGQDLVEQLKAAGQLGELKAGLDPKKPKEQIQINGRERIPDDIDRLAKDRINRGRAR